MARKTPDWLVIIAPGGKGTEKIVSREVLTALGPEGYLVNMARGTLVDEAALVELLSSKALGGAALDVFEKELAYRWRSWKPSSRSTMSSSRRTRAAPRTRPATRWGRWSSPISTPGSPAIR